VNRQTDRRLNGMDAVQVASVGKRSSYSLHAMKACRVVDV
jgi:hypothetical protein